MKERNNVEQNETVEENHNNNETDNCEADENKETNEEKKESEVEKLKKQLREAEEKYMRVVAELDNFRKRSAKEAQEKLKFANQQIITNLLTVIDHLDMAVSHITPDSSLESLKEGVELTLKQFQDVFEKFGVKEIPCEIGQNFDPSLHEAMMLDESDEFDDNAITMVLQKGYQLNDRVIRPSKVKVNKKQKSSSEESNKK
jgi:molecular chaperone GrpE